MADVAPLGTSQMKQLGLPGNGKWFKTQQSMFDYVDHADEGQTIKFYCAWDVNETTGAKCYGAFETGADYFEGVEKVAKRNGYELARDGKEVLAYSDVDIYVDIKDKANVEQQMIEEMKKFEEDLDAHYLTPLRRKCFEVFQEPAELTILTRRPRVYDQCGRGRLKVSAHIIIRNISVTNNDFGREMLKTLMQIVGYPVDNSVYSKNRVLQTMLCSKKKEKKPVPFEINRNLNPSPDSITSDMTLVTQVPLTATNIYAKFSDYPVFQEMCKQSFTSQCAKRRIDNSSDIRNIKPRSSITATGDDLEDSLREVLHTLLSELGDDDTRVGARIQANNGDIGFQCHNGTKRKCLINSSVTNFKNNCQLFVSIGEDSAGATGTVKYVCYSEKCRGKNGYHGTRVIGTINKSEHTGWSFSDIVLADHGHEPDLSFPSGSDAGPHNSSQQTESTVPKSSLESVSMELEQPVCPKEILGDNVRIFAMLDKYSESGEINSYRVLRDLEAELSLKKGALLNYEDNIKELIQLWVRHKENLFDQVDVVNDKSTDQCMCMDVGYTSRPITDAVSDQNSICSPPYPTGEAVVQFTQVQKDRIAQNLEAALAIKRNRAAALQVAPTAQNQMIFQAVPGKMVSDQMEVVDDKSKRNRRRSDEGGRDRGLGQEGGGSGRGEGGGGDDGDDGNGGDDGDDGNGGDYGDDGSGEDDAEENDNSIGDNERSVDADQFDYILKNLNPQRFEDESSLLVLCQVCNNENQIDVLRRYHNFDLHSHEWLLKEKKPSLNVHALIDWLRNDNFEAYRKILFGICAKFESYKYVSQHKLAILYFNMNPDQYLYDNKLGWCEFNAHNVLEIRKETPASLISDISKRLGRHFEDLVLCCQDNLNADPAGSGQKTKESAVKSQMKRTCTQVGTASFVKGIADFLKWLCQVSNLTDKIDSNRNLLAFENLVFDLNLGRMRKIHPSDCITKTTRYQVDLTRNSKIEEQIKTILWTIFEDDQIIIYWWTTIALSVFGISFQSLYIHTGGGRNGKGILAGILQSGLGDYFQTADNAFLTTTFDSSRPNSVLAQCHGKRLLCVSEPETGKPDCTLTVGFVKYITGNDAGINTRDLNGKAFTYKPLFAPLLLCNNKPRLSTVDVAIEERFKIIEYPFKFVDNPRLPSEKRKDNHLKTKVEAPSFINEFILMLCDIAFQNKDVAYIQLPEKVAKNNSDYVEENNVIKHFIYEHYEVTHNPQDCVKASDLLTKYKHYSADQRLSAQHLKAQMTFNGFKQQSKKDANYYLGLKEKGF
jgi:phage/plasmid-associated DNA primase